MHKEKLFDLPYPTTSLTRDPYIFSDGGDLLLSLDFIQDRERKAFLVRFTRVRSFRARAEIYCSVWHITDSYDAVCEVIDSEYSSELKLDSDHLWREKWILRHFIIYIDSFGCLEVIGEKAILEEGGLEVVEVSTKPYSGSL